VSGAPDHWLAKLFDQNAEQHRENSKALAAINAKLGELLRTDDRHGFRLDALEGWRREHVDPFLDRARDGISQAKGAGRFAKILCTVGGLVGGGVLYKFGAALIAALPK
jgi:hypothetical protein